MTAGSRILGLALVAVLATHLPAKAAAITDGASTQIKTVGILPDLKEGGKIELTSPEAAYPAFEFDGIGVNVHTFDRDVTLRLSFDGSQLKTLADAVAGDVMIDVNARVTGHLGIGNGDGFTESGGKEVWGTFTGTVSSLSVVSDDPAKVPAELLDLVDHPGRIGLDSPFFRGAAGSLPPVFLTLEPAPVPEPATLVTLVLGAAGFGLRVAHRRRKARANAV